MLKKAGAMKGRPKRFNKERRRQLLRRHKLNLADRRSKWFYATETCNKVSTPIDLRDPEEV
ncbi:hypothetical protein [Aliidiomarina sanyensis]|uniref:hypothetical protein n=1 Tax=Aliidiomarina sanyensis TaxID=1249555 RepID=UPI000F874691|nr:hypothetical protein [Aliidiomarina sanyensis]